MSRFVFLAFSQKAAKRLCDTPLSWLSYSVSARLTLPSALRRPHAIPTAKNRSSSHRSHPTLRASTERRSSASGLDHRFFLQSQRQGIGPCALLLRTCRRD